LKSYSRYFYKSNERNADYEDGSHSHETLTHNGDEPVIDEISPDEDDRNAIVSLHRPNRGSTPLAANMVRTTLLSFPILTWPFSIVTTIHLMYLQLIGNATHLRVPRNLIILRNVLMCRTVVLRQTWINLMTLAKLGTVAMMVNMIMFHPEPDAIPRSCIIPIRLQPSFDSIHHNGRMSSKRPRMLTHC